jgi:hypothetical protein
MSNYILITPTIRITCTTQSTSKLNKYSVLIHVIVKTFTKELTKKESSPFTKWRFF